LFTVFVGFVNQMITSPNHAFIGYDRSLVKILCPMRLMDEKRVVLIRYSWTHACADKASLGALLCKMMIDISDNLKPIVLKLKAEQQISQILEALDKIVSSLPDFNTVDPEVSKFVSRYAGKGITNENYEDGVIALLMTLEKKVKSWTPEFREAWIFLFASIHLHFVNKVRSEPSLDRMLQRRNNFQHEK
jgi:hypothetical protein